MPSGKVLFDFIRTTASLVNQIERVQGSQASRHSALVNMAELRPEHVANLLVGDDLLLVPDHTTTLLNIEYLPHEILPRMLTIIIIFLNPSLP